MRSTFHRCSKYGVLLILSLWTSAFAQDNREFDLRASTLETSVGQSIELTVMRKASDTLCAVELSYGDGDTQKRRLAVGDQSFVERHSFSKAGTYKITAAGAMQIRGLGNIASACPGDDRQVTVTVRDTAAPSQNRSIKGESPTTNLTKTISNGGASQGRRVALVIGNSDYQHQENLPKLDNPTNDAEDVAAALRGFGFEVLERKNQTLEGMNQAIADFGRRIADSDAALFYFAGHGLQVKNQNYLMPINAKVESEAVVPYQGINVNQILDEMDTAKSAANIVMLDACRNNPISGKFRSGKTRGLASPGAVPKGTVIVYATDPGNVAADGDGRNGLFTSGLLKAFKGKDLTLDDVLTVASAEVESASGNAQTPYVNGPKTLQKNFNFRVTLDPGKAEIERTFWTSIERTEDPANFDAYLRQYPNGSYKTLAENRLRQLKAVTSSNADKKPAAAVPPAPTFPKPAATDDAESAFWNEVKANGAKEYYDAYVKQYPKGKYLALARIELKKLDDKEKADKARDEAERKAAVEREKQEQVRTEQESWDRAKNENSVVAYSQYLDAYPKGRFAALAVAGQQKAQREEAAERERQNTARKEQEAREAEERRRKQEDEQKRQTASVASGPTVKWRLASSFPKAVDIAYGVAESVAKRTAEITGGKFQIQVFAAGELMPSLGVFDGVSNKTVEVGHTASFYYVGKDPAFAFDTVMPAGLSELQQRLWLSESGELPLLRSLFRASNIYNIPCGRLGGTGQWWGWSRKEINSLQDMQGLKYRVTGLDSKVFQRIGVSPQAIAGGELFPALQKGIIDAAQWLGPYDGEKLGLHKVAPYFYKPLAHRSFTSLSLYVHLDEWRGLPPDYQRVLKQACEKASEESDTLYRQRDSDALSRLVASGTKVRDMPKDVEQAFDREAALQNEELAAGNESFRKLYSAWKRFKAR